jgi:hypothetical protein
MAYSFQGWADAPSTGAYEEHLIAPIFRQAVAETLFVPLASRIPYTSGESATVPIRSSLSRPSGGTALNEALSIPLDKLTITAKTISLQERGRGVMVSSQAIRRSPIDLLNEHQQALSEQLGLDMDAVFAAQFKAAKLVYTPTGAASYSLATAGTAGAAAANNVNFYHLRKMRDLARRTYLMPAFPDGRYRFVVSTSGFRSILEDPERVELQSGAGLGSLQAPRRLIFEDVVVMECNHDDALDDDVGTNSDVGEGVFIARDAVRYVMAKMPSIVYDRTHDHGRFTSLAWYGDYGVGTSTDSANAGLARLISVEST